MDKEYIVLLSWKSAHEGGPKRLHIRARVLDRTNTAHCQEDFASKFASGSNCLCWQCFYWSWINGMMWAESSELCNVNLLDKLTRGGSVYRNAFTASIADAEWNDKHNSDAREERKCEDE